MPSIAVSREGINRPRTLCCENRSFISSSDNPRVELVGQFPLQAAMHTFGFWHEEPGEDHHDKTERSVNKICPEAIHAECGEHAGRSFGHDKIEQPLAGRGHSHL